MPIDDLHLLKTYPRFLQLNSQVGQLSLYDIAGTPGVAADVSHCNTKAQVKVKKIRTRCTQLPAADTHCCGCPTVQGYDQDKLAEAVRGCDLVIIPAGVPRKPGMTRDDLFKVRSGLQQPGIATSESACAMSYNNCAGLLAHLQINAGIVKGLAEAVGKHAPGVRHILCAL